MIFGLSIGLIGLICFVGKLLRRGRKKRILVPLMVFAMGCLMLAGGISTLPIVCSEEWTKSPEMTEETAEQAGWLAVSLCLTETEASQVSSDLKSIGIIALSDIRETDDSGEHGLRSFSAAAAGKTIRLTLKDGETYSVKLGKVTLYDIKQGGALRQIIDCGLSEDEAETYMATAEKYIGCTAKHPESVKFASRRWKPEEWSAARYKNIVQVESYVEAKNSMGAMQRTTFLIQMTYDEKTCLYIALGGKKLYGTYTEMSK